MSVVTGIMLICDLSNDIDGVDVPCEQVQEIMAWLAEREYAPGAWRLAEISSHAGGFKHPQFDAFCGGFNNFGSYEDNFAGFVMSREWDYPENVVLAMQPEDGETRVFRPKEHAVVSIADVPEPSPMKSVGSGAPIPDGWGKLRT